MTTQAQVAKSVGVSVPTVSKVLNNRADVSPETRSLVHRALLEQGYQRRRPAARQRAGLVDLVVTAVDSPWAVEVLRGAEDAAHRAGSSLVVTSTHGRMAGGRRWLQTLARRQPDGIVLVVSELAPGTADELADLHTPLVLLDPAGGSDPHLMTVGATNWAGGLSATDHLLGLGHRRVGLITGLPQLVCSQERLEGYRAAHRRAGVELDEELIRFGDFRPDGGRREMATLLDLADPPTAVFAGSDMQALGVYEEARTRGLRIPEDLSVVGFDDLPSCHWMAPALTTVRQPLAEMAAQAVRLALQADETSAASPPRLEMATNLVVRASTTAPPAAP